jgi:hypothetical protein
MRGVSLIVPREASLSFAYAESAQPLDILRRVAAPTALSTAGERQRSESLTEPEPARTYAELVGSLAYRECMLLLEHTLTLHLTCRCL